VPVRVDVTKATGAALAVDGGYSASGPDALAFFSTPSVKSATSNRRVASWFSHSTRG